MFETLHVHNILYTFVDVHNIWYTFVGYTLLDIKREKLTFTYHIISPVNNNNLNFDIWYYIEHCTNIG